METQIKLNVTAISHTGSSCQVNDDNFYINGRYMYDYEMDNIQFTTDCCFSDHIFAVSDGLDRVATEKRPSISIVKELKKFQDQLHLKNGDFESRLSLLKDRMDETYNIIYSMSLSDTSSAEKDTAFSSLFISEGKAATLSIGKSKVYLYRDGIVKPLSGDMKKSDKLLKMGIITSEQANLISGKFGVPVEDSKVGIHKSEVIDVKIGDIFLLFSDGISGILDDEKLNEIISVDKETGLLSNILVKETIKNGSKDNMTVVVVKIEDKKANENESSQKYENKTKRYGARVSSKRSKGFIIGMAATLIIILAGVTAIFMNFKIFNISDPGPPMVDASKAMTVTEEDTLPIDSSTTAEGAEITDKDEPDTTPAPTMAPTPTAADSSEGKQETDNSAVIKHVVVSGDSLQRISKKYYNSPLKYKAIMEANNLKNENELKIGQVLIIPKLD